MSYAKVAAQNAPPPSEQPVPDQALLNTASPPRHPPPGGSEKVVLIDADYKDYLSNISPEPPLVSGTNSNESDFPEDGHKNHKKKQRGRKHVEEMRAQGSYMWQVAQKYVFRPQLGYGLVGIVNVGLLASIGHAFYAKPELARDRALVAKIVAASVALLSAESCAAYHLESDIPSRHLKDHRSLENAVTRPGVLGGFLGLVNTTALGVVGYIAYSKRNLPTWDKRVVTAISAGLFTLIAGEGFLADVLSKREEKKKGRSL